MPSTISKGAWTDSSAVEPEFEMLLRELESKFWDYHEEIRISLEEKGLI